MINLVAATTSVIALPIFYTALTYDSDWLAKKKLIKNWNNICTNCNLKNKDDIIPYLNNLEKTNFGFKAITRLPSGISLEKLENAKQTIEDNLSCMLEINKDKYNKVVNLDFINKQPEFLFKPTKANENELWLGYKANGKPYKIKLNKDPHLLIGGTTGTGKTFLLAAILSNLIYNNPTKIEIYLSQIMKGEIGLFRDCKPVKSVSYSLLETSVILEKLAKKVDTRSKEFSELGIKNLDHWNSKYGKKHFKKRIFMVIEEVSFFIAEDSEDEDIKELKSKCWKAILTIAKAGRSSGIHFLSCTQRSTCANLPSEIKAQMTRVSLKQRSSMDSVNIINTADASRLGEREFIVDGTDYKYLIAPKLDEEFKDLKAFVPEIVVPEASIEELKPKKLIQSTQNKPIEQIPKPHEQIEVNSDSKVIPIKPIVIKTTDKEKDILKFLENYGAITLKQASKIFFSNLKEESAKSSCSRTLTTLEKKGLIKSEIHAELKEKVVFLTKTKKVHDLNIINAYVKIKELGAEITLFKTEHHLLGGKLRPDGYIEFKLQEKSYKAYIECDYTHFTGQKKMALYEQLGQDFVVIIGKEEKLCCSSKKLQIIQTSVDFSNLEIAIKDKLVC